VPVWKDPVIAGCLEGLARQTCAPDAFEVIVVDNGSEGDSREFSRCMPSVRIAYEATPGSYAARTAGIRLARGSVLAFTDADCVPAPDWIEAGVEELRRLGAEMIAGRIDVSTRVAGRPSAVELYEVVFGYRQEHAVQTSRSAYTANLFVQRRVFDSAGAFAELRSGGDFEFTRRAQYRGFKLAFSPLPAVVTPARTTLAALWRRSARLRGGQQDLRRLRPSAPWLQGKRTRRPRFEDFRTIAGHPAPLSSRLGATGVALFVRAAFKLEGTRLALGGRPRR
jgi:glycosyltransferase involved in cell wall biosynthesis